MASVFGCTWEVGYFQLLFTWTTCCLVGLEFVYVPTLLAGLRRAAPQSRGPLTITLALHPPSNTPVTQ